MVRNYLVNSLIHDRGFNVIPVDQAMMSSKLGFSPEPYNGTHVGN